jgi:CheY-like chemotaxis protein
MTHGGVANGVILGDDDLLVRGIISSILRHAGQQVFPACDGVEAVNLAQQFQARLVLLDINMPRLNGLLAFKAIRAIPAYGNVPIVMLTAYTDIRMRLAAEALGANGYITSHSGRTTCSWCWPRVWTVRNTCRWESERNLRRLASEVRFGSATITCDCRPTPIGNSIRAARCCASFGRLNAMKRPLATTQISKGPSGPSQST